MTHRRLCLYLIFAAAGVIPLAAQSADAGSTPVFDGDAIAARVEDQIITIEDLRWEIYPRQRALQARAHSQQEFDEMMAALRSEILDDMINRVLAVKEFNKDGKRHVPTSLIDNAVAEELLGDPYNGDRALFLKALRNKGLNMIDHRKKIEEEIIYNYMRGQLRKSMSVVSPARVEAYYAENSKRFFRDEAVHMRLISFNRGEGETDARLLARAQPVLTRLQAGEKFETLAREASEDNKKAKGGDWGWQKRTDLKPEFGDPLFKLEKGHTSDPIVTTSGCYLLFAEDHKLAGIAPLAEVNGEIENILAEQSAREAEAQWVKRLRANAYIIIY